jgi:transcriptional regulator with XRE-family HTH domain
VKNLDQAPKNLFYRMAVDRLIEARLAKSWSQYKLAKAWNRNQSILAKVETGQRNLDLIEFVDLCAILDLDPLPIIDHIHAQLKCLREPEPSQVDYSQGKRPPNVVRYSSRS